MFYCLHFRPTFRGSCGYHHPSGFMLYFFVQPVILLILLIALRFFTYLDGDNYKQFCGWKPHTGSKIQQWKMSNNSRYTLTLFILALAAADRFWVGWRRSFVFSGLGGVRVMKSLKNFTSTLKHKRWLFLSLFLSYSPDKVHKYTRVIFMSWS